MVTKFPRNAASAAPPSGNRDSVDAAEIRHFTAHASAWWDTEGEHRFLHRLNPVRIAFVRDRLCWRFGRDAKAPAPLNGLRVLDLGCGGGLLSEPLARLGAKVVGADPGPENIAVARAHAAAGGLDIDYRAVTAEDLAGEDERFDVILAMEVVEHVADLGSFIIACGALLGPAGALLLATLNRTAKSFAFAIVGAEYVLHWLPPGTHHWDKFVRPHELATHLRAAGFGLKELTGVTYDPFRERWMLGRDLAVNYMAVAEKLPVPPSDG